MWEEYKKIIIAGSIATVMIGLTALFAWKGLDIGPLEIASVETIMVQHDKVKAAETELTQRKSIYDTNVLKLEMAKKAFDKEKAEYEAISDETIKVIKEATTQEEYSIEYMWIRLGNYAKRNNLEIVLVEPGGAQEMGTQTENTNTTTTTSTPVTSDEEDATNTNNKNAKAKEDLEQTTNVKNENSLLPEDDGTAFKIQVSGSYMNVSDFVFAVENDSELRFKLDNIAMEYISGTTIKTTFDVKNMKILK